VAKSLASVRPVSS